MLRRVFQIRLSRDALPARSGQRRGRPVSGGVQRRRRPASTDCFLAWGNAPGKVITCTDGDPSCDVDGAIDGVCTFGLSACTNVAVGACVATPLDAPPTLLAKGSGAEALTTAIGALPMATEGCTDAGLVKVAIANSQSKLKPAKVTLRATAVAGGKKDTDTFKLVCNPGRPTLATNIQPIFTSTCTFRAAIGAVSAIRPRSKRASAAGFADRRRVGEAARVKPATSRRATSRSPGERRRVDARRLPDPPP
jgi:hypothetical protein